MVGPTLDMPAVRVGRFADLGIRRPALCLRLLTVAVALSASTLASAQRPAKRSALYATHKGAWFNIDYPRGWKVQPLSRSTTSMTGSDSARFTSPNGSVEFYVFSPQWNGNPTEAALDPKRERLVSHHTKAVSRVKQADGGYLSEPVANWYTVQAKDDSYQRSWVDVEDKNLNVRHVFGIKYRDKQAHEKYRVQYLHFCKSLEQFSD